MALCKFGHVSLVNKISQKLLKLEPWNLMNRLVAMSRWPDYAPSFEWNWWGILFCLHLSIRLFVRSSSFFCACLILRTLHARVLKFYIWVPNEKIADPYFVSCLVLIYFTDNIIIKTTVWANQFEIKVNLITKTCLNNFDPLNPSFI